MGRKQNDFGKSRVGSAMKSIIMLIQAKVSLEGAKKKCLPRRTLNKKAYTTFLGSASGE